MAKKAPVMEIFGPTIQGEGIVTGRKTMFVRTGGCDYSCACVILPLHGMAANEGN